MHTSQRKAEAVAAHLGMWVMVYDGEAHRVFVPAQAYTGETIPRGATLWDIVSYVDGDVVPRGMYAVMHMGACVGVTRIVCAVEDT